MTALFSFFLLFCASLRLDSPGFQTGALLIERVSRSTAQASSTLPAAQYGLEAHSTAAYSTVQRMRRVVSCQRVASYVLSLSAIFAFFFFLASAVGAGRRPWLRQTVGMVLCNACLCLRLDLAFFLVVVVVVADADGGSSGEVWSVMVVKACCFARHLSPTDVRCTSSNCAHAS